MDTGKLIPLVLLIPWLSLLAGQHDYVIRNDNYSVNWTRGIISLTYKKEYNYRPSYNEEREAFQEATFLLVQRVLELPYEGTKTIKDFLKENRKLQKEFHEIQHHIKIEKKMVFLNSIEYDLSLDFFRFFQKYLPSASLVDGISLPVRKEKDIRSVVIYAEKSSFQPSLVFSIYSENGKKILSLPAYRNLYVSGNTFLEKKTGSKPYIIYTGRTFRNMLVLPHSELQYILATTHGQNFMNFHVILYDESG